MVLDLTFRYCHNLFSILSQDLVEERVIAASHPVEGSMNLQPIDYDPIYLETIGGQKKQRVYNIDSKGVAFCSSSRASSSSVIAVVDERVEQRVMKTNERITVYGDINEKKGSADYSFEG